MPFKSKSQSRFFFAKHPRMAKEWAEKTDYSKLPEKVKSKKSKKSKNKDDDHLFIKKDDADSSKCAALYNMCNLFYKKAIQ